MRQAILGSFDTPPALLAFAMEADIYPRYRPELAELIDGSIGEGSTFHDTFHYDAQSVALETARLAPGWERRLVKIQNANTDLKIGWCLAPEDLAALKLAAGRDKDWPFVRCMIDAQMVARETLTARFEAIETDPRLVTRVRAWISSNAPRPQSASP